jgi:hypothetical protein
VVPFPFSKQLCPINENDMKNRISLVLLMILLRACSGNRTESDLVIAQGQMPAIAMGANKNIHLVYGIGDSIMYTYSNDKGRSFAPPVVIDTLIDLVDYATRGPQIAVTKNSVTVIAVNRSGNVFSFVKNESGKWIKTARVNDADTVDKEGFLGLAGNDENNLFAIWPDLRDDSHQKIYGARSADGGRTWSQNILVYRSPDSSICECCKPSVIMRNNNIYVMFRNLLNGNRDLYLVQSGDGGNSFGTAQKLGTGSWHLNGCPMDGGGLAVSDNGVAQTVWRRHNTIYAATPGSIEKEIGEGKGCNIETLSGKNIYAWTDSNRNLVCLLPGRTKKVIGKGNLPLLKSLSDNEVICVWSDDKNIRATTLTF